MARKSAAEMIERLLPEGYSLGYIGNTYRDGTDDRSFRIFGPAGRDGLGTSVGNVPIGEIDKLIPIAMGIAFATKKGKV